MGSVKLKQKASLCQNDRLKQSLSFFEFIHLFIYLSGMEKTPARPETKDKIRVRTRKLTAIRKLLNDFSISYQPEHTVGLFKFRFGLIVEI